MSRFKYIDEDGNEQYVATMDDLDGTGDMLKSVYDQNDNGIVDNSEKLGGELPAYYATKVQADRNARDIRIINARDRGQTYTDEADTTKAYSKAIPSGAVAVEVDSIGGQSIVWNQQLNLDSISSSRTEKGITFTKNADGSITLNGTATQAFESIILNITLPSTSHKYYGHTGNSNSEFRTAYSSAGSASQSIFTVSNVSTNYKLIIDNGETFTDVIVRPAIVDLTQMFGAGNEPTTTTDPRIAMIEAYLADHPEYNAGELKSADVESVECVGANLIDKDLIVYESTINNDGSLGTGGSVNYCRTGHIRVFPNTSYFAQLPFTVVFFYDASKKFISLSNVSTAHAVTTPENCYFVALRNWTQISGETAQRVATENVIFSKGTSATSYSPYKLTQLTIPEQVRTLYPLHSAGNVYDEYVWYAENNVPKCKYVKRVDIRRLDSIAWEYFSASSAYPYGFFYGTIGNKKHENGNLLVVGYTTREDGSFKKDMICMGNESNGTVYIIDSHYTSVESFVSAKSDLDIYYELATPVETDITSYFDTDSVMECEGNGTITFKQTDAEIAVPNELLYMVKTEA